MKHAQITENPLLTMDYLLIACGRMYYVNKTAVYKLLAAIFVWF